MLSPELADYLLAILYITTRRSGECCARLVEVSKLLGVAKPTASLMVGKLVRLGLVVKRREGVVLSRRGIEVCDAIVRRHSVIEGVLTRCGLSRERACEVARKLEVILDEGDIDALERGLASALSDHDSLACRIGSALRARRRGKTSLC